MNTFLRKALVGGALVATTLTGGALGAALINGTASAADNTATTAAPSAPTAPANAPAGQPSGPHVANGVTEAPLTGDDLAKATAAALKAVPGGTIDRAETDADGAAYEAHMTNAEGQCVTVLMDKDFNVTSVEQGRGPGGGMGHGGPGAPSTSNAAG
jgi:hypothetical protein